MKIGTLVEFDSAEKLPAKIAKLCEYGVDNCQLCCWDPKLWTDENAEMVRKLIDQYHITVSAFWCGWEGPRVWDFYEGQTTLGLVPPKYRVMRIGNLCDGADFAKKIGVTDVITHMGFIPENPYDPEFEPFCDAVRTVALHLKDNGQFLLFEAGQETPVTMLRCFEKVGTDNLGINLDTANVILYGKANPVDALDVFGRYVRNVHAKDGLYPVNGHDLGQEVQIGKGKVDFRAFFKKLHELGYDSYITIEREIDEGAEKSRDILESQKYMETIIAEVCGG